MRELHEGGKSPAGGFLVDWIGGDRNLKGAGTLGCSGLLLALRENLK
jgi:hypothetical protein